MTNWVLGSGEAVVDRHQSHIHVGVLALLPAAFLKINSSSKGFLVEEVDFGRPVGETVCVGTTDADEIIFAQRPRRAGLTRFAKNRTAEQCSSVVIILKQDEYDSSTYVLITAFVGRKAEKEPWDRNILTDAEYARAEKFWSSHALVWGSEPTIAGTETTVRPW